MKTVATTLLMLALVNAPVFAQKTPVEGFIKSTGYEFGEKWLDSGRRTHFFSVKSTSEVTVFGENVGFRGKAELDWGFTIVDKFMNGRISTRHIWTSDKDPATKFKGHNICELTAGSASCVLWLKGYGEFAGKILELNTNEKDDAAREGDESGPNVYILEGYLMDEPTEE